MTTASDEAHDSGTSEIIRQIVEDSRQRVEFVSQMTAESVSRVLSAVEQARPLHTGMYQKAQQLSRDWESIGHAHALISKEELSHKTQAFFNDIFDQHRHIESLLREILVALEFQDLTGQTLKKILSVLAMVEKHIPRLINSDRRTAEEILSVSQQMPPMALNRPELRFSQQQVDDLLSSIGI